MPTSFYQNLKIHFLSLIPLSRDAVHIHLGLCVFFICAWCFSVALKPAKVLMPVFLMAAGMEMLDCIDDLRLFGRFRWEESLHDMINTLFWPVFIICFLKLSKNTSK